MLLLDSRSDRAGTPNAADVAGPEAVTTSA